MKWKKLGKIFEPDGSIDWMKTHASVPFCENLENDIFKIYFSSRNKKNESSIGFIIVDIKESRKIISLSKKPILSKGELGTFDDSGVMGSCLLEVNNKKYLYYIGWNLGVTVPFRNSIGLAISDEEIKKGAFCKEFKGPILDRTKDEPHFVASNCVIKDDGIFKMWYLSCTTWSVEEKQPKHHYHIKYAESRNGIDWERNGIVAIDYRDKYEYAISVPRVIKENGIYKMWFSSRASNNFKNYKIRYAESLDGKKWVRKDDEVGIDVSTKGWDSEMICYPFVFKHKSNYYMLYNGNDYGKSGIGLAILEQE